MHSMLKHHQRNKIKMSLNRKIISLILKFLQLIAVLPCEYNVQHVIHFKSTKLYYNYSISITLLLTIIIFYLSFCWVYYYLVYYLLDFVFSAALAFLLALSLILILNILYQKFSYQNDIEELFNNIFKIYAQNDNGNYNRILYFRLIFTMLNYIIFPIILVVIIYAKFKGYPFILRLIHCTLFIIELWGRMSLIPLEVALPLLEISLKQMNKKLNAEINNINLNKFGSNNVNEIDNICVQYFEILNLLQSVCQYFRINLVIVLMATSFTVIRKIFPVVYFIFYVCKIDKCHFPKEKYMITELVLNISGFMTAVLFLIRTISLIFNQNTKTLLKLRTLHINITNIMLMKTVSHFLIILSCKKYVL